MDHKHDQTGMTNPKFAKVEVGEVLIQSRRNDGVKREYPNEKVQQIP